MNIYLNYCKNNYLNVLRNVLVIMFRTKVLILINIFQKHLNNLCNIVLMYLKMFLKNSNTYYKKSHGNNFQANVLILINIFSNISQILCKIFCRHSTHVLCLV